MEACLDLQAFELNSYYLVCDGKARAAEQVLKCVCGGGGGQEPLYFNLGGSGMLPQKHLRISKALKRYFLHFEGRVNKKLLRQTTVFSLSQYFTIQFNKQILGFNNYKYSIHCTTKCIQSQYYGIVLNTVNW